MKILLATDGSQYSDYSAQFLTRINLSQDDSITVFHAIFAVPFRNDEKFYFNTLKAIKKELGPRILDSALAILKPVKAAVSVQIDEFSPTQCTPERCIMDAAEAANVDMIVMGARGIKGIASAFLGSVTRLVTIKATKPVLAVRPPVKSHSDSLKILFAADGSPCSRDTAEILSAIPFPDSTEVTIINVIVSAFSDIPQRFMLEINDRIKEAVAGRREIEFGESEQILEQSRKILDKRYKHIHILSKVGDASTEILKISDEIGADLIAVGSRGVRGIEGLLGSVSRNVLTHSRCSVLIGKTRTHT
ncbi:MAG TPA: universal stress protein [Nitrospirota bacterium]|nr:universal stress protein [Nitrospirota bacterium]